MKIEEIVEAIEKRTDVPRKRLSEIISTIKVIKDKPDLTDDQKLEIIAIVEPSGNQKVATVNDDLEEDTLDEITDTSDAYEPEEQETPPKGEGLRAVDSKEYSDFNIYCEEPSGLNVVQTPDWEIEHYGKWDEDEKGNKVWIKSTEADDRVNPGAPYFTISGDMPVIDTMEQIEEGLSASGFSKHEASQMAEHLRYTNYNENRRVSKKYQRFILLRQLRSFRTQQRIDWIEKQSDIDLILKVEKFFNKRVRESRAKCAATGEWHNVYMTKEQVLQVQTKFNQKRQELNRRKADRRSR